MYTSDDASEPRAKPVRPITEPVMHTARDPYRVIATLMKMPINNSSSSNYKMLSVEH